MRSSGLRYGPKGKRLKDSPANAEVTNWEVLVLTTVWP